MRQFKSKNNGTVLFRNHCTIALKLSISAIFTDCQDENNNKNPPSPPPPPPSPPPPPPPPPPRPPPPPPPPLPPPPPRPRPPRPPRPRRPPPPPHHRHRHLFALFQYSIFKRFSASFLTRRSRETTGLLGETTSNANIFTNDFKFYRFLLENSLFNTNHDLNLLVLSEIA